MSPAGQQSQLSSPTVQLDIDQIKFYQPNQQQQPQQQPQHQQSAAAVLTSPTDISSSSFPIEQPAAVPAPATSKMSPLTTLKQELAKLHQKRFTVAAVASTTPLTTGPTTSSNGTPLSYSEAVKSSGQDQPVQAPIQQSTQLAATATVSAADGSLTTPAPLNRKISRFQVNVVPEVQQAPVQHQPTPSPPVEVGTVSAMPPVQQQNQTIVLNTMENSGMPQQAPSTLNAAVNVIGTVHHDEPAAATWNMNQYPITYNVSPTPQNQGK